MEILKNIELFERVYVDSEKYDIICSEFGMTWKEVSSYVSLADEKLVKEKQEVKRLRGLYQSRKGKGFPTFGSFYRWHQKQLKDQKGECYYCHTPEYVVRDLCLTLFKGKIRDTRGKHLEVERKDSVGNEYNERNCVLACYFCNNDKSNVFNEDEYFEYLGDRKSFLEKKHNGLVDGKYTNTLFFSSKIIEDYHFKQAFDRIQKILDKHQIDYHFLEHTKDIWCQDYMPIQVNSQDFVQFRYEPSYLKEDLDLQSDPKTVLEANGVRATFSDINLDGGNVVKLGDKAILTERIIKENGETPKEKIVEQLEALFKAQVFFIPDIPTDMTGHSDGYVRFINGNTILVNELENQYKYWRDGFLKMANNARLNYVEMPWFYNYDREHPESAMGCYLNYLEIGDLIVFPIFEVEGNKDEEALDVIKRVFPKRIIEPVNINELGIHGGLANCCTWNVKV